MRFEKEEIKDLVFSGLILSIAFSFLLAGGLKNLVALGNKFISLLFISFITGGTGFLLHELMHKFVAQKYKLSAKFKAFYGMLWLAVLFSFFGFILVAPGAVFISGRSNKEKNGKIALAGPLTNIALAFGFLLLIYIMPVYGRILELGLIINSILASFNMIPVMPFDGGKIFAWSKLVWFVVTTTSVLLFILSI